MRPPSAPARAASRRRASLRPRRGRAARRRQRSNACGQRGLNGAAGGMAVSRGIAPSICSSRSRSSSIAGIEPIRPTVYGCAGAWITASTGPISTMRPAYMTATRSQVSAITPMSCVTSMTAAPCSLHSRFSSEMICAWIETSSAVVGSSATISLRLGGERQRDDDALAHAAGELVRVLVDALLGRRDAGLLQQADGALARLGGADRQVRLDRLDQLLADGVERVERGQRVLEDRADVAAAHAAHRLVRQVVDAPAVEADLAAGDAPGRVEQADDRGAGQRLAGARFADHAEDLARARCRRRRRRARRACRDGSGNSTRRLRTSSNGGSCAALAQAARSGCIRNPPGDSGRQTAGSDR